MKRTRRDPRSGSGSVGRDGRSANARESPDPASPRMLLSRIRMLRGRGRAGAGAGLIVPSLEALLRQPRRQLLEYAQRIGLTGIHRLTKDALATRFRQEFERLAVRAGAQEPADAPRKFDLGLTSVEADEPVDIPWGYGEDRVTAMAVDPERLYVYWEVTDDAIERARAELGLRRPGRLARPAGLRRHQSDLRRHQRSPLLRSLGRADRPAMVLLHRPPVRPRSSPRSVSSRRRATSSASRAPAGRTSLAWSRRRRVAWSGSRCSPPAE